MAAGFEDHSRVWLITGTTSGFGRRLVTSALARGDKVVATSRSLSKLEDLANSYEPYVRANLRIVQLDVTEGCESIKMKVDHAAAIWGRLDVVVNNAGVGLPGLIEEGGSPYLRRQFDTNVFGLLDVTTAALPHLRAQKAGTVVIVGSRSSWRTEIMGTGHYAASKAAVRALSETLTVELSPLNIRVLLVEPGGFRTEGMLKQVYHDQNPIPDYDLQRSKSMAIIANMPQMQTGNPDKAMEIVVDVVRGEGVAEGRQWPGHLILGEDADYDVRLKCSKVLTVLDQWRDVTTGVGL
ncbi:hypothetical protein BDQ17DRAFT_1425790 [Cyathus striatus]|nr:hypothetical protein BDQ17DRAFT_1425790 [Cyathus striatus]